MLRATNVAMCKELMVSGNDAKQRVFLNCIQSVTSSKVFPIKSP